MAKLFTRRQFGALAAGGMALALPVRRAFAQSAAIRLKYGTAFPADHPGTVRIKEAAEAIRRDTGGKVDLQVYPNSQLGSEPDMISQTLAGAIDFMSTAGTNLQTRVPAASINGVAYAFKDYATVWAAMDGALGAYVRAALARVNLHVFEKCLDNGYRHITSSVRPVNTPADLKGFKIRVPAIPLWVAMFKTLGASPTVIPFADLYSALQTRVVDGQETPLSLIRSGKLYEVQKYCSLTGHTWDGHFIFGNAKKFQALPREVQASLTTRFTAAALKQREDIARADVDAQGEMVRLGITFNRPDPAPFRQLLQREGFYTAWRQKFGDEPWRMLEQYTGPLA
ncbi:TRAP transporter substrate-binding protein [Cupriavidus sp. WKF15]|uniref:TRAP transporter substrate-binding protein n=1 Tax=Cupriavidus sp. WKF15 TaxID=3032282 RepID=UPI0023E21C1F|nr:TRAP transporter substrate-binding protein [Cupriavidus sp. WKF15]WER45675.1 TRAP transporter substrate-binding protein [Cupriavidus sp. WKF15]